MNDFRRWKKGLDGACTQKKIKENRPETLWGLTEMKENIGKQSRDEMVLYVGGGRHDMYTIETEEGTGTL